MPHREVAPRLRANARALRSEMTEEEGLLWSCLRLRRLGVRFRRQVPIGQYIVDFACYRPKLIVEVDGVQHAWSSADAERDQFLELQGWRVLRFWNSEVNRGIDMVEETIVIAIEEWRKGIWPA